MNVKEKTTAIGIDLGTTNTVVSSNAEVLSLHLVNGGDPSSIFPSVISFAPSGSLLAGHRALDRRVIDPLNTIISSKRIIGESWGSYNATKFRENYAFNMVRNSKGKIAFQTRAGRFSPEQIASLVVNEAWKQTSLDPKQLIVVVTVPTAFEIENCEATKAAITRTGVPSVRVIHEPVATALAYLGRSSLRYAAIYDLGGGTFDLSIVDCSTFPLKVVAFGGDLYLGGDDIDLVLAEWVADEILKKHRWDLRGDPEIYCRLIAESEQAKIRLSKVESTTIAIKNIDAAAPRGVKDVVLERERLWERALPTIRRTFGLCDEVLDQARLTADDIEAVFTAGGTTSIPGLREYVGKYFGKRPRFDLNPMHVVSLGASISAVRAELADLVDPVCDPHKWARVKKKGSRKSYSNL